ncbi:hypothetical protein PanWU01x14_358130 [Parasponia andersonii]|uniref:Uncharacterized protein n=1 Tax=Parasponia andersonii TaxID=3476 RepID=A0A2P5A8C6_PARAD|nr:hypothetical protein PanWU01x14_358130 [Parasponia andersonii]
MHGASGLYRTLFCDGGKNNNHRCSLRRAQGGVQIFGVGPEFVWARVYPHLRTRMSGRNLDQ